jgi:N-methylhydantoinase A
MATGVREVSVRRGLDPRDFPLVVAGGAGPVHAAAIALELEIPMLLVPRESSIFCAAGMLISDFKHDFVRAYKATIDRADMGRIAGLLAEMEEHGRRILAGERVEPDQIQITASLDLRYVGQWHELTLPVAELEPEQIAAAFHAQHDHLFGYSTDQMPVEVLACRVAATGITPKPEHVAAVEGGAGSDSARIAERPVWSPLERRLVETLVFDGHGLGSGAALSGPAIVELANTTIVVLEGFELLVDAYGSFVVYAGERGRERSAELVAGAAGPR